MRLLYVCNDMSLSGSPQAIVTETSALVQRGHEVWVVSRRGPLAKSLLEAGVHWVEASVPIVVKAGMPTSPALTSVEIVDMLARYFHRLRLPRLVSCLAKLVMQHGIDLIQAHQPGSTQAVHLVSLLTGVPFIVRVQHSIRNEFPPFFYRWVVGKSSDISVISREIQQNLARIYGIPERKTRIIPTGVNLDRFGEIESLQPCVGLLRIASISTLGDGKHIPAKTLLEAALLAKPGRQLRIDIVGDGARSQELAELAKRVNAASGYETAVMVGATPDVRPYLRAADLVVGVGRVAMETLAAGRLLFCASNSASAGLFKPDCADQIADFNFSGRHTTTRPSPQDFANTIENISRWPSEQLQDHARWGQTWVKQRFDLDHIVDDTERMFLKVLSGHR